jgi:hypothetical protein
MAVAFAAIASRLGNHENLPKFIQGFGVTGRGRFCAELLTRGVYMRTLSLALAAFATAAFVQSASAAILITVDKSTQQMTVEMNGLHLYTWPVSTGKSGHDTPSGSFKTFRMEADHFSREWDDAPMPNSIFFTQKGHAIHGSFDVKHLGQAASHGCVRLAPQNAKLLFDLVKQDGVFNTQVVLKGEIPGSGGEPVASRRQPRYADDSFAAGDRDPYWDNQRRYQYREDYRPRRAYRYGEEIAPRTYDYPDSPGRTYYRPRYWGWQ